MAGRSEYNDYAQGFGYRMKPVVDMGVHINDRPGANRTVFPRYLDRPGPGHDVVNLIFRVRRLRVGGPGFQNIEADAQAISREKFVVQLAVRFVAGHNLGHVEYVHFSPAFAGRWLACLTPRNSPVIFRVYHGGRCARLTDLTLAELQTTGL